MGFSSLESLEKEHEKEVVSRVSKYLSNIGYSNFSPNNIWMLEEPILEKLRGNSKRVYQKLSDNG
ncbi:TPA: hypothetical protein NKQ43_002572 [Vibrio parahaemolyticus]|uniref:hypothetical protein n=1 Tax=Vibrio parahaemolyticus TaxID=670 RepID=UPI00079FF1AD|nr:hypothetical protein [Vibrio parahaemolyticus]KYY56111.1 hypothetical protein AWQ14_20830 [Vibrio parahaemolyticus]OKY50119.1 hypothetical protein BUL36_11880 [Vibrio parahaemolyticus]HCE2582293.1 hypothetical protein [Vibrio parahaemolyticus]HCE2727977.1 hypothetical protein [Vibrio parahaemolyticus]HCE2810846.1 hypothetical protein [Vibrio parahaemolyticus]